MWVFAVPLLYALRETSGRESFGLGLAAGLVAWGGVMYWEAYVLDIYGGMSLFTASLVLLLLIFMLALFWAVFAWLVRGVQETPWALVAVPGLWVLLELVRGVFPFGGFPWALAGSSQLPWLSLVQVVSVGGVYLLSALVLLGNAAVYRALQRRWQEPLVAACIIGLCWGWGAWQLEHFVPAAETLTVGVAQGNIAQEDKWKRTMVNPTVETYSRLSREAVSRGAELVVWPETACNFYLFRHPGPTARIVSLSRELHVPVVAGSPTVQQRRYYNRVWLLEDGEVRDTYDKIRLVPFGEYLPFSRILGKCFSKVVEEVSDFSPGAEVRPLDGMGIMICFESVFPRHARDLCRQGAKVLVNVSNDAWFKTWAAPEQHLEMAAFRAVENRRWLIRSVNHGISVVVDPCGRKVARLGLLEEGVLVERISLEEHLTLYTKFGPVIAWVWGLLALGLTLKRRFAGDRSLKP